MTAQKLLPACWKLDIFRPALICGNRTTGVVNTKDWFHRILKAVVDFKIIPCGKEICQADCLNMVCVDYCTEIILKAAKLSDAGLHVYPIAGKNVGFASFFSAIKDVFPEVQELSYQEWYKQLLAAVNKHGAHPAAPFVEQLQDGIPGGWVTLPYDVTPTTSLVPFEILSHEQIVRTIIFLAKN